MALVVNTWVSLVGGCGVGREVGTAGARGGCSGRRHRIMCFGARLLTSFDKGSGNPRKKSKERGDIETKDKRLRKE